MLMLTAMLMAGSLLAPMDTPLWVDLQSTDLDRGHWSLPLPEGGVHQLQLEEFSVLAPGATLVVRDGDAVREPDLGGLRLWRGSIQGQSDSQVFIATSAYGTHGFVLGEDMLHVVSSGKDGVVQLTPATALPEAFTSTSACEVRMVDGYEPPVHRSTRGVIGEPPCRVATIALESDWEFTNDVFDGDPDAAAAYAITLCGGISEIYTSNLNVRFQVGFLRTWASDSDPYFCDDSLLDQFRAEWTANMEDVDRTIAHLLSGCRTTSYGGVAWLSVLCNTNYGYGVSAYLDGFFPQPLENNNPNNWDLMVMAHELGHNFGTLHTHDGFFPTLDDCGNGDCTGAENGTIMSYCHICEGGLANIELNFHPQVREVILAYLDEIEDTCPLQATVEEAVDDWATTLQDTSVVIDVLTNDAAGDCEGGFVPEIDSFDNASAEGGSITLLPGGTFEFDQLEYQPPAGFGGTDSFMYTLTTGQSATVTIDVVGLRPADNPQDLEVGVGVAYYDLDAPTQLPNFDDLSTYFQDVLDNISYPSTNGAFATSGRSDLVGAVFTGYVQVAASGLYEFSTESDDGSALWIGDTQIVDNDGTHGMQERSGTIGLVAGRHAIRVEFFERTGGAGLFVRFEGPGLPRQVIPAAAWTHVPDDTSGCAEDVDGDGSVGVNDLLEVIGSWGSCPDCAADIDGSGLVDVNDVLSLLSAWGSDC